MISLITTTFRRSVQLRRGLLSLLHQSLKPDEIIVVDDGSQDNTRDVVFELNNLGLGPRWEYIYLNHPEHRISCHAKNVGLKVARGDIVAYTDPEILHVGDTLKGLVTKLSQNIPTAHRIWTMGASIYVQLTEDYYQEPRRILEHPYAHFIEGGIMHNPRAPNSDWAITGSYSPTGCFFVCAKEDLFAVGGWDEVELIGHGFDDFDLQNRLACYGRPLLWVKDIDIIHLWHLKDYPYDIYAMAAHNGAVMERRMQQGIYQVNAGMDWGNPDK